MLSPVAVISGDNTGMYPACQGWNGGEETRIPSSQVDSTSTPLGKLSPVISQSDLLSDADDVKSETDGSALRTAIAPAHSNGSLSATGNQAIPRVGNESRPIKACPVEHSTESVLPCLLRAAGQQQSTMHSFEGSRYMAGNGRR
jgi:hypothetical protein